MGKLARRAAQNRLKFLGELSRDHQRAFGLSGRNLFNGFLDPVRGFVEGDRDGLCGELIEELFASLLFGRKAGNKKPIRRKP